MRANSFGTMTVPEHRRARDTDLMKSMRVGFDEAMIALREAYADLTDEQFHQFPLDGHHNIVTLVMHCLQQQDDFNGNLQYRRGLKAPIDEWHFTQREARFGLWGVPEEELPKPGDPFPSVAEVLALHDAIHGAVMENMDALSEADFLTPVGRWPRLCDLFFRGAYHMNAHIRQIWLLRGTTDLTGTWPEQHYA